jgi:hypothetical protein
VVVRVIDVKGIGGNKAENHPPVRAHRYRPKPRELAFERMQPETRHIHIGHDAGGVEPRENVSERAGVLRENAARVVVFIKTFQPLVSYRPDRF